MSRISPIKVRWKSYETSRDLVRAFYRSVAKDNGLTLRDMSVAVDDHLVDVEHHGFWAWVETTRTPPKVHWWRDAKRIDDVALAFVLGHELGHVSGRPKRGVFAEEMRADEYGKVAAAVLEYLSR